MQPLKIIALLAIIALAAVFTFQNTQAVDVKLYFWSFSLSISLLLLATFTIGVLGGTLLTFVHSFLKNRRKKTTENTNLTYHGKDS